MYWTAEDLFNVIETNEKQGISAVQTLKRLPHGMMVYFGKKCTTDKERVAAIVEMLNAGTSRHEAKKIAMQRFNLSRGQADRLTNMAINARKPIHQGRLF